MAWFRWCVGASRRGKFNDLGGGVGVIDIVGHVVDGCGECGVYEQLLRRVQHLRVAEGPELRIPGRALASSPATASSPAERRLRIVSSRLERISSSVALMRVVAWTIRVPTKVRTGVATPAIRVDRLIKIPAGPPHRLVSTGSAA